MAKLTDYFVAKYLDSLDYYKSFYDDVAVYGEPGDHSHVFYFVPGFNGVPGQFRFSLPALTRFFGEHIYARCLHLPEFSAKVPTWDKYTPENVAAKRDAIISDLTALSADFDVVTVLVSSSGFYDFLSAAADLSAEVRSALRLAWVAVAPDWTESSKWEPIFSAINGFEHNGHNWFSYPNHNWLKPVNQECTVDKKWRVGRQKKTFYKNDLESRFHIGPTLWDFISIDCYNWHTQHNISQGVFPLDIPAVALVATDDGYWQGKSKEVIDGVVHKYLSNVEILYRATTHLWVTVPENLTAAYEALEAKAPRLLANNQARRERTRAAS